MTEEHEARDQFFEIVDLPQPDWDRHWDDIILAEGDARLLLNYGNLVSSLDGEAAEDLGMYRIVRFQGPPGTGKTTKGRGLANHVAKRWKQTNHRDTKLLMIEGEDCFHHYLGATAKNLGRLFDAARLLAHRSNVVIFVDEVESLALDRKAVTANPHEPSDIMRGVNKLLNELDRLRELPGILVIMTSNLQHVIDEALSSRTDLKVDFPLPDLESRARIIELRLNRLQASRRPLNNQQITELARRTEAYSGRDLVRLPFWAAVVSGKEPQYLELADYFEAVVELGPQVNSRMRKEELPVRNDDTKSSVLESRTNPGKAPLGVENPLMENPAEECQPIVAKPSPAGSATEQEETLMEDTTKEEGVLERRLNLGLTRLPGEAAQILVNTLDRLAQLTAFPGRKALQEALSRSQKVLALLVSAQLLKHIDVCFEGEVLRITLLYFPEADGLEDNLDLSAITYAEIKTEHLEISLHLTDLNFAQFLGASIFTKVSIPGLKFSLVANSQGHRTYSLDEEGEMYHVCSDD